MAELIAPEDLPTWIPGDLTLDSARRWDRVVLKGYDYPDLDVAIPTMRDYMIVVYEGEAAQMGRRDGGPWRYDTVERGVVSLLTRAEQSQWSWDRPIQVTHLYLSHAAITEVAGEIYERDIAEVEVADRVRAEDRILPAIAQTLKRELIAGEVGGRLMAEMLSTQACLYVLRNYAQTLFREPLSSGRFSCAQRRLLMQYLEDNISHDVTLKEMASVTRLSAFHFLRKFQNEFGFPPHQYLMRERVKLAMRLLARTELPLKEVAARAGFSDQSHMTRLFRRFNGATPVHCRRAKQ